MSEANGQEASPTTAQPTTVIADQGSNGGDAIKVAGPLSEDNRAAVEAKEWFKDGTLDAEKLIGSYRNLESEYSKSLRMPGENATADDWGAFYDKLGRPETADKYELKLDADSVPENFPYDEKSAVEFRNWAHDAGLNPKQAQMLHDRFVGHQAGSFSAQQEAVGQKADAAHREIVSKWGPVESEPYKQNVELMSRAVQQLGLGEAFKEAGVISGNGEILNAKIATAFAKVGKELYAEDTMMTGANGALSNPWNAGKENITDQGRILRSDPKLAKSLIQAAGQKPADYGL